MENSKDVPQNAKISERFSQIKATYFGNSNRKFAEIVDVNETTLSSICNGKTNAGKVICEKVLRACPNISKSWLYFGIGDMLISKNQTNNAVSVDDVKIPYTASHESPKDTPKAEEKQWEPIGSHLGGAREVELMGEIIKMKDDMIEQLKARIEDQRAYIKILSEEHRALVHQVIEIGDSNNELLKDLQRRAIGFEVGGITKK